MLDRLAQPFRPDAKSMRHICLGNPENSAAAQHLIKVDTELILTVSLYSESNRIHRPPCEKNNRDPTASNKFNRDRSFTLSYTWYPVINILKQSTETNEKARPSKASA
jgi:hypothetical protein